MSLEEALAKYRDVQSRWEEGEAIYKASGAAYPPTGLVSQRQLMRSAADQVLRERQYALQEAARLERLRNRVVLRAAKQAERATQKLDERREARQARAGQLSEDVCDAKCKMAHSKVQACRCSCAGENHGAALDKIKEEERLSAR